MGKAEGLPKGGRPRKRGDQKTTQRRREEGEGGMREEGRGKGKGDRMGKGSTDTKYLRRRSYLNIKDESDRSKDDPK